MSNQQDFEALPLNFRFPVIKILWDGFRFSNWYQSKALIIKKIFYCDNIDEKSWIWDTDGKIQPFGVFKNPFLVVIFEVKISAILRCLMSEKICVFPFSQKPIRDSLHNVYIFWKMWPRTFQNCFDLVHTTFLDHFTAPRFVIVI